MKLFCGFISHKYPNSYNQQIRMFGLNLMFSEDENSSPITNSHSQSSPTRKHSSQIQIENYTKVPMDLMKSQQSKSQIYGIQIKGGLINLIDTQIVYSETDLNVQKKCPNRIQNPGQANLTLIQNPVITENISFTEGNFINQQQIISIQPNQETNTFIHKDSNEDQSEDSEENIIQTFHPNPNQKKRPNGGNHAHKKMITNLNEVITLQKIRKLQKLIKQEEKKTNLKLKYVKGSRYGFIQYLQLLKHFFGSHYIQVLALRFGEQMIKFFNETQKQPSSQAKGYLLNLPDCYINAFDQFTSGSVESATRTIYKMDKFKQGTYMRNGVEKVMTLQKHLDAFEE